MPTLLPDWAVPGVYTVAAGVFRIPLPVEVDHLHAVNVYAITHDDGVTIVDSGWAGIHATRGLESGLGALGYGLGDISEFVVTHAHWDHYTQAIALRRQLSTPVRLGRGERASIEGFTPDGAAYPEQVRRLVRAGATGLAGEVAAIHTTEEQRRTPFELPDAWLDDGDVVAVGARSLEVLATPGHTRGHIVLRDPVAGLLFSGDHVLPHITPSLGVERAPEPQPLRSYLASLRVIRERPDTLLLPAHGPVSPSVHVRIDGLLEHHQRRLQEVLDKVGQGYDTAFLVAGKLRWTRRGRALADLDTIHQMTAVLEIQAHLAVLEAAGLVTHGDTGSAAEYAVA